ncbi:hypothetical protein [Burkholderia gladioli]|uniref:hypothetical protein n=1 Tax=Burkholderia gladioli TaxID=28095 RepID=UPI00163FACA5|nr:hypothetical protein [Burkholderia gladioli]
MKPIAVFSRGRHRAVTSEPRRIWPRPVRAEAAEASIHAIHARCRREMKCFVHEKKNNNESVSSHDRHPFITPASSIEFGSGRPRAASQTMSHAPAFTSLSPPNLP